MEKKNLKEQMLRLETNYGKEKFKVTQQMFNLWWEMLSELNDEGIKASVNEYMMTNEYPPTVASILKIYRAKEEQRKDVTEYVSSIYQLLSRWFDEAPNQETYDAFKRCTSTVSLGKVKEHTDYVAEKIMSYYHYFDDKDTSKRKKLIEVIRGIE